MRVQLSQPGLEALVRCARHNLLWDAIPGTNSRQLELIVLFAMAAENLRKVKILVLGDTGRLYSRKQCVIWGVRYIVL